MNKDKLGISVNVGDTVTYATASGRSCELRTGVVTEIVKLQTSIQIKIKASISGNIIHRHYCNIINIEPIKEMYPEYFI